MQPKEEWATRCFLQPYDRMGDTLFGAAVHQANIFFLEGLGGKGVVVEIETASQAPTAVEHECAHYGSSGVSGLFERLCYGTKLRGQRLAGKVLDSILKWISAGQNHGVRRPSQG